MFNSEKMRKTMVVVMFLELLLLAGLLVNDHIQSENRSLQHIQELAHKLTVQAAALKQEQQKTATVLQAVKEQVQAITEQNAILEQQNKVLQSEVKSVKQDVQSLKTEVQQLKKSCSGKPTCCKSKCKGTCPSKDKPSNKKPECGNDKGTTSPPAMHQVEMYYGATKVIITVPPAIPISK